MHVTQTLLSKATYNNLTKAICHESNNSKAGLSESLKQEQRRRKKGGGGFIYLFFDGRRHCCCC